MSDTLHAHARWTLLGLGLLAPCAHASAQETTSDESHTEEVPDESAPDEQLVLSTVLLEQQLAESASAEQLGLHFYGFADVSVAKAWPKAYVGNFPPRGGTFSVGNLNLYGTANLTHGFSSLMEVRFSYLPNANIDAASLGLTSTAAADYADANRKVNWGGIVIERVHLDYSYSSQLNVRVGQWLTPYGIWNVDHGSPTIIPVSKPYPIGEQLFPPRQVGIEVFGSQLFRRATLGYHLTLSNGRGDFAHIDSDRNKAVGARLYASTSEIGALTVGVSGYGGLATQSPRLVIESANPPRIAAVSDDRFHELAFAWDLLWEWRSLRVQSEVIVTQVSYRDPDRKLASGFAQVVGLVPDHVAWGSYLLLTYRLPWWNIMPYAMVEQFDRGYARHSLVVAGGNNVNVTALVGGINVRPVPSVVLKGQLSYHWFPGTEFNADYPTLSFQAAWAF